MLAARRRWVQAMIRCCLSALPLLLLAACGGAHSISGYAAQTKVSSIAVFEQTPADAVDLGEISETTCLNNFFDPRPGSERALDRLKGAASSKGANAVSLVTYKDSSRLFCATGLKLTAHALVATASSLQELTRPPASRKCRAAGSLSDFMACKMQALPRSP